MATYIVRRILLMIPTLLGAVTLIFLLMRLLPGDVALYILGSGESSEVNKQALEQIRQDLGLDQPLIVQYGRWLWGAVRLDFGNSYWTRQPVTEELKRRYPITANLAVMSLLLGTLIAIPVGVLSAVRQDTLADYAARVFVIAGLSLPNFWLAILVILGLVHYFQWLPPLNYAPFWVDPWLNFKQLVFPALVTGYRLSAIGARMTRSSILEVLRDDYVRTARAKGLRELRNRAQARAQKRPAAGDHDYRPRITHPVWRARGDRDGVHHPGHRQVSGGCHHPPGLSLHSSRGLYVFRLCGDGEFAGGYRLWVLRSTYPVRMKRAREA